MRRGLFMVTLGAMVLEPALSMAGPRRGGRGHHRRPEVLEDYIAAWRRGDGQGVAALFGEGGTYADDTGAPLSGQALADYVDAFRDQHFRVEDVDCVEDGFVIHWRVGRGRRCGSAITFRDEVVLTEDGLKIATVRSLGNPPSEEVQAVLAEYVAGWATYDGERTLATFAAGGVYFDSSNPEGVSGEALVAYIESLTWAVIDGLFDLAVLKDGRIFGRWDLYLAETGQLLVQGYDFITMQGNEILVVEGH